MKRIAEQLIEGKESIHLVDPRQLLSGVDTRITMIQRLRRNRKSSALRDLLQETRLHASDLVMPLFVLEGEKQCLPVESLPGVNRLSIDLLIEEVKALYRIGIRAIDLFPVIPPHHKDAQGSWAVRPDCVLYQAVRELKQAVPDVCVMVDIALDPFTDHGHDGLVDERGDIRNDATLVALAESSLLAAEAGADLVAPSDMMDGRVAYIRQSLDRNGYSQVGILAYAAKYASTFYRPYRDALDSAPKFGDKRSYQLNPANWREAMLECILDEREGADMLLIKPALPYLDIVAKVREQTHLPVGAFHVSGEYAMVMAAAERGWLDADAVLMESLIAIKRAGADFIFTYAAGRIAKQLQAH